MAHIAAQTAERQAATTIAAARRIRWGKLIARRGAIVRLEARMMRNLPAIREPGKRKKKVKPVYC